MLPKARLAALRSKPYTGLMRHAYKPGLRRRPQDIKVVHGPMESLPDGGVFEQAAFTPEEMDRLKREYRIQFGTVQQVGPHFGTPLVRVIGRREVIA